MMTKPKVLLGLAIVFIVAGGIMAAFVNTRGIPSLNVVLPLGVVFVGAFLVVLLFEKESQIAAHDQKQALEDAGIHASPDEIPAKQGSVLSE